MLRPRCRNLLSPRTAGVSPHVCAALFLRSFSVNIQLQPKVDDNPISKRESGSVLRSSSSSSHQCSKCARTFSRKSFLENHAQYCGLQRGYVCNACSTLFESKSDLILHRLSEDACYSPEFRKEVSPQIVHGASTTIAGDRASKRREDTSSDPTILDPNCAESFPSSEPILMNKLIHSTSPEACERIVASRAFHGFVPEDQRYDGFQNLDAAAGAQHLARTYFEVRPASDGLLFPFSRFPKRLDAGAPTKMLLLDASMLLDDSFSLFYVSTTPTLFGQSFSTVYQSHVAVAKRGSVEERFALDHLVRIDKHSNRIFALSGGDDSCVVRVPTRISINAKQYPHAVILCFLGGVEPPEGCEVETRDGTKISFGKPEVLDGGVSSLASQTVQCPHNRCNLSFNSISNLKTHFRTVHARMKPFSCSECGKSFSRRLALTNHERLHGISPAFECMLCDNSYTTKEMLIQHVASFHRRELHRCDECQMDFTLLSSFRRHVSAVHRGEKPHSCAECERSFAQKSSLRRHLATIHGLT